jgi:hypothetical protein
MNNEEKLVLHFDDDGDGTGKLTAEASSGGFSGIGEAWFDTRQLLNFAKALETYPLPSDNVPKLVGGCERNDSTGRWEEEHLAISVYPIDGVGSLGIHVRLSTQSWSGMRPEEQQFVKLEIITNYNALEVFSKQFVALIKGKIDQAVL